MRTSSMLTSQISGGRGVSGAHKLIPMPLGISRARTTDPHLRATIKVRPNLKPRTSSLKRQAFFLRTRPPVGEEGEEVGHADGADAVKVRRSSRGAGSIKEVCRA